MRARAVAGIGLAAVLATTGVVATAGTALAGTNGQQVSVRDTKANLNSVRLTGKNQHGEPVTTCVDFNGPIAKKAGWWWKGGISLKGYSGFGCSGRVLRSANKSVPETWDSDWFEIRL
ncbi:hypothetical protein [Streptomyces abikoensis]|uniref:hypothetical protein n=1 Tax=Streptomyces abikoensis TaxID=97398 RepID=UPI001675A2A2|nr:hypothetical protein [Streptomyces abikoensis]GGP34857.1 hypothetical protein GCM10010214_04190 [Streptomyces abikoensis]